MTECTGFYGDGCEPAHVLASPEHTATILAAYDEWEKNATERLAALRRKQEES